MDDVVIKTDFINLGQLLKYLGFISNGSEAKIFLFSHEITVNNVVETRRGRKIYPDFIVKIDKKVFKIIKNDN